MPWHICGSGSLLPPLNRVWEIKFRHNAKNIARKLNQHSPIQTTNYDRKMSSTLFDMAFVTLPNHLPGHTMSSLASDTISSTT